MDLKSKPLEEHEADVLNLLTGIAPGDAGTFIRNIKMKYEGYLDRQIESAAEEFEMLKKNRATYDDHIHGGMKVEDRS